MGGLVIETVRPGVQFIPDAAAAFRRADAQVRAEFGRGIDVNSTYRSWDTQLGMFNAWQAYIAGRGPYPGHSKALHPSDPLAFHVAGTALDSDDWTIARIVQILAENGFIRNRLNIPNEKHHFEWLRNRDTNYGKPISGGASTASEEDEMIRIQAPNKGIAMIGAGYYRPLANADEVNASTKIMSRHIDCTDKEFDLFVSVAVTGTPAGNLASVIRTAARPLRLYKYSGKLIAMGEGGRVWELPDDNYRILLDALGLAGPDILRDIPKNELDFMQMVLGAVNPDPVTQNNVDAILKITPEDAQRIAAAIGREPVVLSSSTLAEISKAAVAGAREGGEAGAAAAISGLSFLTTIAS